MNERTCSVPGCDRGGRLKLGMCGMHYQRSKSGKPMSDPPKVSYGSASCRVDGCDRKPVSHGLCSLHWQRDRKGIELDRPLPKKNKGWVCSVDGCRAPASSGGMCPMHYTRWRAHGDVNTVKTIVKGTCSLDGCQEPHYAFGYCNMHSRRLKAGKPLDAPKRKRKAGPCVFDGCDKPGRYRGLCGTHRDRVAYAIDPEPFKARVALRRQRVGKLAADEKDIAMSYRYAIRTDPCAYCGALNATDVDHFFPIAKGGSNEWVNLVRACDRCNSEKWARCGTWYRLKKGYLRVSSGPASDVAEANQEHRRIAR